MDVGSLRKVTVIGAGIMGSDIALRFALAGYEVTALDFTEAILARASERIRANCLLMAEENMIDKEDVDAVKSRIRLTLDWEEAVSDADYITEAVPENMQAKQDVFRKCDELCPPNVIVASNTSSMSITRIASLMNHPERAVTTHWTIPAHLSPVVEVIAGERTSADVPPFVVAFLKTIGKEPVICKDSPGFIHNYVQFAMVNAALDLVERGIATPEGIDNAITNGFGLRLSTVGPIRFVDLVGLDTFLNVQRYLFESTHNEIYKPSKSVEENVRNGRLGAKSGGGYYSYDEGQLEAFQSRTNRSMIRVLRAVCGDQHAGLLKK